MTRISEYPIISLPAVDDLLIGTDVSGSDATKNFTIQSVINLNSTFYAPISSPSFLTTVNFPVGTTSTVPFSAYPGSLLTTQTTGAFEYDVNNFWLTKAANTGRGIIPVIRSFYLNSVGTDISSTTSPGVNYFGTNSNIPLVANGLYEIEINLIFAATGASTKTIVLTNDGTVTSMNVEYEQSPSTGIVSPSSAANGNLKGFAYNVTTSAYSITTPSLSTAVSHRINIKLLLKNGTGTSLKTTIYNNSAVSITPGIGSYWKLIHLPSTNLGTYIS